MTPNLDTTSTSENEAFLSIGDVVTATGVGEATLRAWERRFGFPDPRRLTPTPSTLDTAASRSNPDKQ